MIAVYDDVLADPAAYREAVLAQPFGHKRHADQQRHDDVGGTGRQAGKALPLSQRD